MESILEMDGKMSRGMEGRMYGYSVDGWMIDGWIER